MKTTKTKRECLCHRFKICGLCAMVALGTAMLSLMGCTKGADDAPPPTVSLDFVLDSGGMFADKVSSVDVGIFDGAGDYLRTEHVEAGELAGGGMNLALDPGDYRLVFWGNVGECTKVEGVGDGYTGRLVYSDATFDAPDTHVARRSDPLYYGPYGEAAARWPGMPLAFLPITVTGEPQHRDVTFTHAFRELSFFVGGLPDGTLPVVELEGCPEGLSFSGMMTAGSPQTRCCLTRSYDMNGARYAAANFRTFRFANDADIDIVVHDAAHAELYRTTFAHAMSLGSGGEGDAEQTGVVLDFTDDGGYVNISVVPWNVVDVGNGSLRNVE